MGKSTNFSGQPIFTQLLNFLDKTKISKSSKALGADKYVKRFSGSLADSRLSKTDMKRLYIMDSTNITLFKEILRGVGRNPANGKRKGGIKAHTIIRSEV
jgi:hypothetical protein